MLPSAVPTQSVGKANPVNPQESALLPYTFAASKAPATNVTGGSVKVIDSRTFHISKTTAVAEVTTVPGGIHGEDSGIPLNPNRGTSCEFGVKLVQAKTLRYMYSDGNARVTVFASSANARTFDYPAGDIGYIPRTFGSYVENTENGAMKYLEIFKTDVYEDISLNQWLALAPPDMIKAHLQLDDETISRLQKVKPIVVGPGGW